MSDVEAIERATLSAVAPLEVLEIGGWLIGLENGSIRRGKSAVPLKHDLAADPDVFDQIERAYVERGLSPAFRLADMEDLAPIRAELSRRGYRPEQPTLVKTGAVASILNLGDGAEVIGAPDDAWAAVFLGGDFDPVEGAYRVQALSRSAGALFGRVRQDGETVAVGVASAAQGFVSFHGMRTASDRRGQGHAGKVLAALANAAHARGIERAFLQVEEPNASARALYRRAGLTPAWRYHYWSRG